MNTTPLTLLWTAGALAATAALALDLPDPTRPPHAANPAMSSPAGTGMGAGLPGAHGPVSGGAGAQGLPSSAATRPMPARSARLSAVLMADAPGRDAAVIDGVVRHVGDRLGEGTVVAISPQAVTIKGQGRTTRLSLYDREPDPVAAAAPSVGAVKGRTGAAVALATRPTVSPSDGAPDPAKEQP